MADSATATKKAPAKKAASSKQKGPKPSSSTNTNETGDVTVTDPTNPPATTAGINATKEVTTLGTRAEGVLSDAQIKAQTALSVAEATEKVLSEASQSTEELNKIREENDKKGVDKDGNVEDAGLTERLMREKLDSINPVNLAKEHVAYVTDQENIFNVHGLSAPAVPVAKDSGK